MAKRNILDAILNTINEVQQKNRANPNEETADPTVFDLIKNKLQNLDERNRAKRKAKGKSPVSFLDRIRQEIESAKRENKKDPNVTTAPGSVFENILKKIDQRPKRQASSGLRKIVEDYNLDISAVPREIIQQVQDKYLADRKKFDHQYAQALHDLIRQY